MNLYIKFSFNSISTHKGVKFHCDQRDYVATQNRDLVRHNKSIYKGVIKWQHRGLIY